MINHGISPESKTDTIASQTIRILIVDDRTPAREGLQALLSSTSEPCKASNKWPLLIVGEACDGVQALQMVETTQPDIVIMDVRMPGLSGIETTRLIKARWPSIYIVLLSLYGVHKTEALEAGADSFLLKGCPTQDLFKEILKVMSWKRKNVHQNCL